MTASIANQDLPANLQCPLLFSPVVQERVWGGDWLRQRPAVNNVAGLIGESWEICDRPDANSVVRSDQFSGWTLQSLRQKYQQDLLGLGQDSFPLLLKLLDSHEDLSVQVHPDDAGAALYKPGELGKMEAWYIIDAAPAATIYLGLKPGIDRAKFTDALNNGTVADCLNQVSVQPGQVFFIPPGLVHALGAGIKIYEIQQNSDLTFRVFDWNRQPARTLHLEAALKTIDFANNAVSPIVPEVSSDQSVEKYIRSAKFALDKVNLTGETVNIDLTSELSDHFVIVTTLDSAVQVITDAGEVNLKPYDSALVPAASRQLQLHSSEAQCLLAWANYN